MKDLKIGDRVRIEGVVIYTDNGTCCVNISGIECGVGQQVWFHKESLIWISPKKYRALTTLNPGGLHLTDQIFASKEDFLAADWCCDITFITLLDENGKWVESD